MGDFILRKDNRNLNTTTQGLLSNNAVITNLKVDNSFNISNFTVNDSLIVNGTVCISNGTLLNPAIKFSSYPYTGLFNNGGNMGIVVDNENALSIGVNNIIVNTGSVMSFTNGGINITGTNTNSTIRLPLGTATAAGAYPAFTATANSATGRITIALPLIPAAGTASLVVSNTVVDGGSAIFLTLDSTLLFVPGLIVSVSSIGSGTFTIKIYNPTAAATSGSLAVYFFVTNFA